jgi:hypothetical protein
MRAPKEVAHARGDLVEIGLQRPVRIARRRPICEP